MDDFRSKDWETRYQEAVLESDQEKLPHRVREAEFAILLRWRELGSNTNSHKERQAIGIALSNLKALEAERLHFQNPLTPLDSKCDFSQPFTLNSILDLE